MGWKSHKSAIAEGQRIHYNFVMPHEALGGMTPVEKAGINRKNKCETLIKNSTFNKDNYAK